MKKNLHDREAYSLRRDPFIVSQSVALAQDHAAKIQQVLELAHKYRQFNGTALVAENGKVIYKGAFGMANMEWNIPNTPETKFRLGSITKQFTAVLTLQLVEQGKIKLDGKVSDYLPDYRKDIGDKVTMHHLLTHTSGIPSYTSQPGFFENVSRNPYKVAEFVKQYASGDLEFDPGSKYAYNNSGYFLLGAIIEQVTGKSYEQVLKENIFDPVGMKNTGYDHHNTLIAKRASGYAQDIRRLHQRALPRHVDPLRRGFDVLDRRRSLPLGPGALHRQTASAAIERADVQAVSSRTTRTDGSSPMLRSNATINRCRVSARRRHQRFHHHHRPYPNEKNLIVMLDNTGSPNLDRLSDTIAKILYNQPYEPPKMSIAAVLEKTIREKGIEAGVAEYRDLKAKQSATYDFGEPELNALGYELMRSRQAQRSDRDFQAQRRGLPARFQHLRQSRRSVHEQQRARAGDTELQEVARAESE